MTIKERNDLILSNIKNVEIISKYIYKKLPKDDTIAFTLEDLQQVGIMGLIDSAEKFDSNRKVKFSSYSSLRVRGAILDEIRKLDWASRNYRTKLKKYNNKKENVFKLEKRLVNHTDLDISLSEFNKIYGGCQGVYNIDNYDKTNNEKYFCYYSTIQEDLEKENIFEIVNSLINIVLIERDRNILHLYYFKNLTMKQIAEKYNLTESGISLIIKKSLKSINVALQKKLGKDVNLRLFF